MLTQTLVNPRELAREIAQRFEGVVFDVWNAGSDGYVEISKISIPKSLRGQGIATIIMKEFIAVAKVEGWSLALTPSDCFGSSVPRLKKFYKSFGFVENKGRNKDFSTMQGMLLNF